VGWNWVKQVARFHDVWAITRTTNRYLIEQALAMQPMPNVCWIYLDLSRWSRFWKKGQRGVHLYYYLWQMMAYHEGRRLHRDVGFDLVHHIAFGNYWLPSFLSFLPVPFVWGPLGGGESTPSPFYATFSSRGKAYERLRNIARRIGENDPFVRVNARRARVVLAKAKETAERLAHLGARDVRLYPESGITAAEIFRADISPRRDDGRFRLVSIGQLLHWKGFHLGLMAFARCLERLPGAEYWVIGEGPERRNLERLVQRSGLTTKVKLWGNLPRQMVLEKLRNCDALVHPSLHDSGGWVCLEAMSCGIPIICLDLGGPSLQVTDEIGIKIPAISPEQVVNDVGDAMVRLSGDATLRIRMGSAGRQRLQDHFDWDKKGEGIRELYEEVMGCNRGASP
jgi:glycosyltransferase involved in cell wall biosynthesis